ncbi:MAG: hypothetical protein ABI460_09795 [Caldimonas sp.]
MTTSIARIAAFTLAGALALAPAPGAAIAPILLLLVKQIVKDAARSMLKDMVLSSLNGMGCKGMAIANALEAIDLGRGAGGGMMGMTGGGMPKIPAGMSMPGIPGMPGAMPGNADEMTARMRELMPGVGQLPAGSGIDPDQMARIMQAMSQPLSPPETLAVIDEMAEIGFLPKSMQTELKECLLLLPAAAPALGMGMGMLKPMLPKLRQAREQLYALPPPEQDELVAALGGEMKALSTTDRKTFLEFLDSGFFPKRIADGLRAELGAK